MSYFKRTVKTRSPRRIHSSAAAYTILPVVAACSSEDDPALQWPVTSASTETAADSDAPTAADTSAASVTSSAQASNTSSVPSVEVSSSTAPVASTTDATTSEPDPILEALPVIQAKILTQREYRNTVASLLQADPSELSLPEDTAIAGFGTVGATADHHGLTHSGPAENERAADIEKYIMEQYADMVAVLRDTPVGGDKSALDQTLLYGVTEVSEPNGHVMANYHIVLTGHAGGKMPGNQHLRFPGSRKVTELQLTMLQMMGLEIGEFGTWDKTSSTIPEIMALYGRVQKIYPVNTSIQ